MLSKVYFDLSVLALILTACATVPPTALATPGPTPSASLTPSAATRTLTATPIPTATPDPLSTPTLLNPCALATQNEAAATLGEPVLAGASTGGSCIFLDSATGTHLLSVFAVPAQSARAAIAGHVNILRSFGAWLSPADLDAWQAQGEAGDLAGVITALTAATASPTTFAAQPLANLGDAALWASKENGSVRQGFLLVAQGEALIGVDIVVTSARAEASARDSARDLARQILIRLPARFTLTVATPSATVTPLQSPTVAGSPSAATPAVAGTQLATPAPTPGPIPQGTPPAFSVIVHTSDHLYYGGLCGTNLLTLTVTVVDPPNTSGIMSVGLVFRVIPVAPAGSPTDWITLPMVAEGNNVWSRPLIVERDIPNYTAYLEAKIEYYLLAANGAGVVAASDHSGLGLTACSALTPTP